MSDLITRQEQAEALKARAMALLLDAAKYEKDAKKARKKAHKLSIEAYHLETDDS